MHRFYTLFYKELLRFWKVSFQTIIAPIAMSLLYLLIFSHVLNWKSDIYPGVTYISFLIPGLTMMSMQQNSFANSSSSLIQSKITGNIIFMLLSPLSHWEIFFAYLLASMIRGITIGICLIFITYWFIPIYFFNITYIIIFSIFGVAILGICGFIAGVLSDTFDQLAIFQSFIITPLTFLSGVFYTKKSLSYTWNLALKFNPFFYIVDGFRYGFFGKADNDPFISFLIVFFIFLLLSVFAIKIVSSGYKLRY